MRKIFTVGIVIFVVFVLLGFMPVHGESEIYDNVIRLHVIANSDKEEDQALKLKVRDDVLEYVKTLCADNDITDIEKAKNMVNENLDAISCVAQKCITEQGYTYDVEVLLSKENYPTRNYEDIAFPAGRYLSLQIKIGEADGENWWCVLFPPLCLSVATESTEDALVNIGFSGEQYKIITDGDNVTYNVRFKILETVEKLFS